MTMVILQDLFHSSTLLLCGDIETNPGPSDLNYEHVDSRTELTLNDYKKVWAEVYTLSAKYHSFGNVLGVQAYDLDAIQHDNPRNCGNALEAVIKKWLVSKGPRTWRKLVEAVDHPGGGRNHARAKEIAERHPQAEIEAHQPEASQLRNRRYGCQFAPKTLLPICLLVALLIYILVPQSVSYYRCYYSLRVPLNTTEIYGRELLLNEIVHSVKTTTSPAIINVYGPPGIGKSELSIHVGNIVKERHARVYYVNLNQTKSTPCLLSKLSVVNVCEGDENRLLILDNADYYWSNDNLMKVLSKCNFLRSNLTILLTSRYKVTPPQKIRCVPYPVTGISNDSCISFVSSTTGLHDERDNAHRLCSLLNNVPQAIHLAISAITHNQKLLSDALDIIQKNHQLNIFMSFDRSMNRSHSFIAAAFLWNFNYLDVECHVFLNSLLQYGFDDFKVHNTCSSSLREYCIKDLVGLSLIDKSFQPERYHFRPFIRDLLEIIRKRSSFLTKRDTVEFWKTFTGYYQDILLQRLEQSHDVELAIRIGSNTKIVNSLLPLISPSFSVTPLLQCAYQMLEDYCSDSDPEKLYQIPDDMISNMIYAIAYLTKHLFCPMVDTVEILRETDSKENESTCTKCLDRLDLHLPVVNNLHKKVAGNVQAMEARAFYYRLSGASYEKCKYLWPYRWYLSDLANIVSFAKRRYTDFLNQSKLIDHSSKVLTDVEDGLEMYSHLKFNETKELMDSALHRQFDDDQCNFVTKLIAIMVLHSIESPYINKNGHLKEDLGLSLQEKINSLSVNEQNYSCFIAAVTHLFIPFFESIGHVDMKKFYNVKNSCGENFNVTCISQNLPVGDCVRKRYKLTSGSFFFNATELKDDVFKDFTKIQEPLVCSLLRDIAVDCPSPFRSPLSFIDSAKKKRTEQFLKDLKHLVPSPGKPSDIDFTEMENLFESNPYHWAFL